jgi:hypothetical protein
MGREKMRSFPWGSGKGKAIFLLGFPKPFGQTLVIIEDRLPLMTPRYPFVPSWEPQTSICDILKVFPTVGVELERLGVPPAAVHDCITVGEVANHVGWNPYTLRSFLIPTADPHAPTDSRPSSQVDQRESCVAIVQALRADHVRLLGAYIGPIREQWEHWESKGYPPDYPQLGLLRDEFETLCAEISCHFLLEEEELFPYAIELHEACTAQVSAQDALKILENKSLTDDGEIIALVDLLEHLLSRFPEGYKTPSDAVSKRLKAENTQDIGRQLWANLMAFRESWMLHEAKETTGLFPRILELENHLLRKN